MTEIISLLSRFASAFPDGEVTTFRRDDLPLLKDIVSRQVETIKVLNNPFFFFNHFIFFSVLVFIQQLNKSKCLLIIFQNIHFQV